MLVSFETLTCDSLADYIVDGEAGYITRIVKTLFTLYPEINIVQLFHYINSRMCASVCVCGHWAVAATYGSLFVSSGLNRWIRLESHLARNKET